MAAYQVLYKGLVGRSNASKGTDKNREYEVNEACPMSKAEEEMFKGIKKADLRSDARRGMVWSNLSGYLTGMMTQ